ncbi:DNA polymerase II [Halobacteriales archaeon QS_1_68_20]|nr:MAG: DNA polymerase II [Halobacteriales archaeon QS_1_68_20]
MHREEVVRVVRELARQGYNAEPEAATLLANAPDPDRAIERAVETAPEDALKLRADHVRSALADAPEGPPSNAVAAETGASDAADSGGPNPSVSTGDHPRNQDRTSGRSPVETKGSGGDSRDPAPPGVAGDMTGRSTGTGSYDDFVTTFRDRYERLGGKLRSRVNHRPAEAIESMPGGSEVAMVGMVNDVRSTASGHWLVELEDTSGTFPWLVMKDRDIADLVDELLLDEVIAAEGTLADDAGIAFVDSLHFPDVPRTYEPDTADRPVQAALISDVHVGSQEFLPEAWSRFTDWLHTPEGESVEYVLIAGDMVEGVGVYPGQEDELVVKDVYDQYETFSEHLKEVPGDVEIVMIPGNHDAVRLAEPQPGFDEELRSIMSAHDARIASNPATVTVEGVDVLMYHGVSLDEVIAELPDELASYDEPDRAMTQLLKKRHLAPQFGGRMRIAPEERDYLVIDEVPDVFHAGHVHKIGVGTYHGVRIVNSGTWQAQTNFQQSVDLDPDVAFAPILDLDTLDVTLRKFQ